MSRRPGVFSVRAQGIVLIQGLFDTLLREERENQPRESHYTQAIEEVKGKVRKCDCKSLAFTVDIESKKVVASERFQRPVVGHVGPQRSDRNQTFADRGVIATAILLP